jgi:hypothetical protein
MTPLAFMMVSRYEEKIFGCQKGHTEVDWYGQWFSKRKRPAGTGGDVPTVAEIVGCDDLLNNRDPEKVRDAEVERVSAAVPE